MAGFYEDKGKVRHMVIIGPEQKQKLKDLAKEHGLTQGEIVEVLMDSLPPEAFAGEFKAKRLAKRGGKLTHKELVEKLKRLTPTQLAEIEKLG